MTSATRSPSTPEDRRALIIETAMDLFWRKGFDGVLIDHVVEATGLSRYSVYQLFPDGKKEIFLGVLTAYCDEAHGLIRENLARPDTEPIDAVRDTLVAKLLDPEMFPSGCLMTTTAADVAARDTDVAQMMARTSEEISRTFAEGYRAAQADGRAPADGDPEAFAEIAHALYFSTGVQARMGRSREDLLAAIVKVTDTLRHRKRP